MSDVNYNITWDESGKHYYETGVDHGVLYLQDNNGAYPKGEAWNGLSAVTQSPSGAEANPIYADNIKYLNLFSVEDFGGTIEAYYYPDGFEKCNGRREIVEGSGIYVSMQERATFGLAYRTKLGNDVEGDDYAYKLHLIYGAKASPSEMNYQTTNDSPEPIAMSWEFSTVPVNVPGFKPTAYMELSSKDVNPAKLAEIEAILYGTAATEAVAAVYEAVPAAAAFDGTKTYYTRTGAGTSESPYVYAEATGLASFADQTTYYTLKSAAVDATTAVEGRLPLPAEIIELLGD